MELLSKVNNVGKFLRNTAIAVVLGLSALGFSATDSLADCGVEIVLQNGEVVTPRDRIIRGSEAPSPRYAWERICVPDRLRVVARVQRQNPNNPPVKATITMECNGSWRGSRWCTTLVKTFRGAARRATRATHRAQVRTRARARDTIRRATGRRQGTINIGGINWGVFKCQRC